jgi:MFS family permease
VTSAVEFAGPRTGSHRAALGTVLAVLFLTFLDTTIVSVTLGDLETDISAGVIPLQWVINAYSLVFASLMLVGGSLADRFGRKWVVMGLGAAASEPGTLSVIRQLYPQRRQRARALGAWSAVSGLALALGPVIGGLLVGADGWRAIFWFNLVLGVVLAVAVFAFVPDSSDPQSGRLDFAGFFLGTAGFGCVIFAAISGEYKGYGTAWIIALFVIGAVCLVAFVPVELRVRAPMLDLSYIRKPIVGSALFAAFAVYFGVFAIFFLTALYLDIGLHYSGWKLAGMFAPMAAAIVIGGLAAGRWVARAGSRQPLVVGCALGALGTLLGRVEVGRGTSLSFGVLALALALAGLGFGITVVPLTSAVLSNVPARLSGMAASATNTARQLGAVVGVAVLGAIVNAHLTSAVNEQFSGPALSGARSAIMKILETGGSAGSFTLDDIPPAFVLAFLDGVKVALLVATALIVLAGIAAAMVREPPVIDDEDVS